MVSNEIYQYTKKQNEIVSMIFGADLQYINKEIVSYARLVEIYHIFHSVYTECSTLPRYFKKYDMESLHILNPGIAAYYL